MPGYKEVKGGAIALTLNGTFLIGATSCTSNETPTGWPTAAASEHVGFVAIFDKGTANEEKVLFTGRSGSTFTGATRGYDGSSEVDHSAPCTIHHVLDADTIDDLLGHAFDVTRHDHSQYLRNAEHDVIARHTFGASGALGQPGAPSSVGLTNVAGTGARPAREDHQHAVGATALTSHFDRQRQVAAPAQAVSYDGVTWTNVASFTISLPAGWTSMDVLVHGVVRVLAVDAADIGAYGWVAVRLAEAGNEFEEPVLADFHNLAGDNRRKDVPMLVSIEARSTAVSATLDARGTNETLNPNWQVARYLLVIEKRRVA